MYTNLSFLCPVLTLYWRGCGPRANWASLRSPNDLWQLQHSSKTPWSCWWRTWPARWGLGTDKPSDKRYIRGCSGDQTLFNRLWTGVYTAHSSNHFSPVCVLRQDALSVSSANTGFIIVSCSHEVTKQTHTCYPGLQHTRSSWNTNKIPITAWRRESIQRRDIRRLKHAKTNNNNNNLLNKRQQSK